MPIHPCGMVMDYARRCDLTYMRLWADSLETTEVRWFFTAPDAKVFPGAHRFGRLYWEQDPEHDLGEPGDLGEQQVRGTFDHGANDRGYEGLTFCGSLQAFEEGGIHGRDPEIHTDQSGYSECCRGRVDPAIGGGTTGGGALFIEPAPLLMVAAVALAGNAPIMLGYAWPGEGGAALDASALQAQGYSWAGVGGVGLGGAAPQGDPSGVVATGGVGLSGSARWLSLVELVSRGGLGLAGAGPQAPLIGFAAVGGAVLGGAADITVATEWVGTGGAVLGGAADIAVSARLDATGGVALGGAAAQWHGTEWVATGGIGLAGVGTIAPPATSIITEGNDPILTEGNDYLIGE